MVATSVRETTRPRAHDRTNEHGRDDTHGSLLRALLRLAFPLLGGSIAMGVVFPIADLALLSRLGEAPMFAWSDYHFDVNGERAEYRQAVGAPAGREVGDVGWSGQERVAFRLHLPSRVTFHNSPSKEILRGNIIVWEQSLDERRHGAPIAIDVQELKLTDLTGGQPPVETATFT